MKIEICKSREEAHQIVDNLNSYNKEKVDWILSNLYTSIELIARNDEGKIIGGILGGIGYYAGFYIKIFWIDESERGKGVGGKLLQEAENIAREKGAKLAVVDTFSFQADGFYQQHGYEEYGRITDYPHKGDYNVFFKKELK
ncbi:GNAT family N-acetyltransferase [uncultured Tenacibaculum sp.]|uniref:GNAT family N-acetyltransferase n=1 Tax=uncultured Tenacibaculum sp. TaxID=174713 RepID=UPI0026229D05|nr:GNAT family N-acetyltransferase [uncultured Tenacibaculum sp.]